MLFKGKVGDAVASDDVNTGISTALTNCTDLLFMI